MAAELGKLFGEGSVARQMLVWQVLAQVINAALQPELELLTREVNKLLPAAPLTPAELADMVVRNILPHDQAAEFATESGTSTEDFQRLVQSAGEPPSLTEAIELLRRGLIDRHGTGPGSTSFEQIIAESRMYTKYTDAVLALGDTPLSPSDAVDAVVESQIPFDQAAHEAFLSGINADRFQILVNTRGNPPAPGELLSLWKRGVIPLRGTGPDVLSVQQGIAEGATKNKWFDALTQLAAYLIPPRSVVAMVRDGALSDDAALAELAKSGLTADQAAAYVAEGHHIKTQATRELTVSSIVALYQDRLIDRGQATSMLEAVRYTAEDAAFELDIADFKALESKVRSAVSKVQSLYVAHKIDAATATQTLSGLNVPQDGVNQLLEIWGLERDANVPTLTRAEIVDAVFYSVIDLATGVQRLGELGWSESEALILIGIRFHGKAPAPAQTAPPPG